MNSESIGGVPQESESSKSQLLPAASGDQSSEHCNGHGECADGAIRKPRRWRLALDCAVVGSFTALLALWYLNPAEYTAVSLLRVSANEQQLVFQQSDRQSGNNFEVYKGTQQQLITSEVVLIAALRKPNVASLDIVRKEEDPVHWLAKNLRVEFPDNAEIMRVSLTGDQPEEMAALVNAVVGTYMSEAVEVERALRKQRLIELDRLYHEKETEIRSKRTELKQLAELVGTGDNGALALKQQIALKQYEEARNEMGRLRTELQRAKDNLQVKVAELKAMESLSKPAGESTQDASSKPNQASKQQTNRQKPDLRIVALKARIEILTSQEKLAAEDLDKQRLNAEKFGNSSVDIEMLRSDLAYLDKIFASIADEREKLKVELDSTPRISVFQPAVSPKSPDPVFSLPEFDSRFRRNALVVLTVLAAALIPACIALCRTKRDRLLAFVIFLNLAALASIFVSPYSAIAVPAAAALTILWGICDAMYVGLSRR
jgi:hypothetical protein